MLFRQDVISTGYVPYGAYVRDYVPPSLAPGGGDAGGQGDAPIYGTMGNNNPALNVADPRFSATYGNAFLKQVRSRFVTSRSIYQHEFSFSDWPWQHAILDVLVPPSTTHLSHAHLRGIDIDVLRPDDGTAAPAPAAGGCPRQPIQEQPSVGVTTAWAGGIQANVQQLSDCKNFVL